MNDNQQPSQIARALWMNAGLLGVIILVLLLRSDSVHLPSMLPTAAAQQQMPIGGGAGVFMVPGQFSPNTYGCYLMDVDQQTLAAYQYFPVEHQLRLVAARSFRWDRRLKNFNTTPGPEEIRTLTEHEADSSRVKEQNNMPASPEDPQPKE